MSEIVQTITGSRLETTPMAPFNHVTVATLVDTFSDSASVASQAYRADVRCKRGRVRTFDLEDSTQ